MWTEIKNEKDIEKLMILFGGFHDSCLKDVYITTGDYVDDRLAMNFGNNTSASMLFQRQFKPDSVLELKFSDVQQFNYKILGDSCNAVIYDATFKLENGLFYWADYNDWNIDDNDGIWISAKKVFWRSRPDLIGEVTRVQGID